MRTFSVSVALVLALASVDAHASFVAVDPATVSGISFDLANGSSLTSTTGTVGAYTVLIESDGVQLFSSASGNATIKPEGGQTLNSLVFTPSDASVFSAFAFNAQMAVNNFKLTWVDSTNATGDIDFTGLQLNALKDYAIASFDGSTLKSLTLSAPDDGFKQLKIFELEAASGTAGVPEPSSMALLGLGVAGFGAYRRRKVQKTSVV